MKCRESDDAGRYLYCVSNGCVYYSPDGCVMYRIPENRFYLDINKIFKYIAPFDINTVWKPDGAKPASKTNDIKIIMRDKKKFNAVKIMSESNFAWLDERLLKNFDSNCGFLITNSVSVVYIVENGEIVGLVMPIKIKE